MDRRLQKGLRNFFEDQVLDRLWCRLFDRKFNLPVVDNLN